MEAFLIGWAIFTVVCAVLNVALMVVLIRRAERSK